MSNNEELLDIVDEHDVVIGQQPRIKFYREKSRSFRVINGFLVNTEKKIWIPRRSLSKKLFPGCWDASVGGHVGAGETYEDAFIRETREELGIDCHKTQYQFFGKLTPYNHNVSAFMHVYLIFSDDTPQYNSNDFEEGSWFDILVFKKMIDSGIPTKGDLPKLIDFLSSSFL